MNSFQARSTFSSGGLTYEIFRLDALKSLGVDVHLLPYSIRVLLENLLRHEDGRAVKREHIETLARWSADGISDKEIAFTPARVLLQDFTGVPAVVDLAAMREAMANMGGDPTWINPLLPAELVIDHSVQVDSFGSVGSFKVNADMEFERNKERYIFLKWGQRAFHNFKVVPPDTGIVHQVNLEYLARVVFTGDVTASTDGSLPRAYPDTLVGTDSHTTMVNGLGVLGWGVGGIEAEACMLGQPMSMLIPPVVGFRLDGRLREGATATDLVLTVTQMLRAHGVVGKFVEFHGPGLSSLTLADRATISNMAPEYGATCGYFPVDDETRRYLRLTGRPEEHVVMVGAYLREQGLFFDPSDPEPRYSETLSLNLASVEPSIAGPKNPEARVPLSEARSNFEKALESAFQVQGGVTPRHGGSNGTGGSLHHGSVVIAAITSCTNTSNPSVLIGAGILARNAVERGLKSKPWVKTSLAPGSKVVTEYLCKAGLTPFLEALGFFTVGYGCTTCIGNSGDLEPAISEEIDQSGLVVCSVLSGNRNFEGRINPDVKANYLMSPPLVVAYALAGRMDLDLYNEPIAEDRQGNPVFLREIWPSQQEIDETVKQAVGAEMFASTYADVFKGDERWNGLEVPEEDLYSWPRSTYVKCPPYFVNMTREAAETVEDIRGARVLALLGNSVTTDHISPAGSIRVKSPAGQYLVGNGVEPKDFNQYGTRRGNHEVMVRGTFANIRLRNQLAPGTEGGFTTYIPSGEVMSIYDASMAYQQNGVPLLVLAGREYGTGSSRDWAAKGPRLLGVQAVIAQSYERIHRSNLIGMGILPLQFLRGDGWDTLGLTGQEFYDILGLAEGIKTGFAGGRRLTVRVTRADETTSEFQTAVRIDTEQELLYYRHGGILQFVLRQILSRAS